MARKMVQRLSAVLFFLLFFSSCSRIMPTLDPEDEKRRVQSAGYASDFDDVWRSAIQAADLLRWRITFSNRDTGQIRAQTPRHMGAWGDELRIDIQPSVEGVEVVVRGNYSWEPNRETVTAFLEEI